MGTAKNKAKIIKVKSLFFRSRNSFWPLRKIAIKNTILDHYEKERLTGGAEKA